MWLAAPRSIAAYSIQESILRVKPAAVLITTEVRADVTLNCGRGPVAVTPPMANNGDGITFGDLSKVSRESTPRTSVRSKREEVVIQKTRSRCPASSVASQDRELF